jgi:predicted nucleic acid-binding protein
LILADSSVWIAFFNDAQSPQADLLEHHLLRQEVLTADLILMEVLQGCRHDREYRAVLAGMSELLCMELGGREMVDRRSAELPAHCASAALTVRKSVDVLIATWCIENDVELLHADRDFEVMEPLGLKVVRG